MIVATTEGIAGHRLVETKGEVFGLVVRSRGLGGNITAGLRSLAGGELGGCPAPCAAGRRVRAGCRPWRPGRAVLGSSLLVLNREEDTLEKSAADRMASATSRGWDMSEAWLEGREIILPPIRPAIKRWASGCTARSCSLIKNVEGNER
jgi:Putative heavy-metal-binding